MNFQDERWVRLFTRNTPSWVSMKWESRAVLPLLMRELDRSGCIDLGADGMDGLALLVMLPVTVVRDGVTDLVRRQTVVANGTKLVMPNFLEAQEIPKSDKDRAKAYREKKRSEALDNKVEEPKPETSRIVTPVTIVRDASQNVTPVCAVLVCDEEEREPVAVPAPVALALVPNEPVKTKRAKPTPKTLIDPSFQPDDECLAKLAKEGISAPVALAAVSEFVEYWTEGEGKGKRHVNWPLTFRDRLKRLRDWDRLPGAAKTTATTHKPAAYQPFVGHK